MGKWTQRARRLETGAAPGAVANCTKGTNCTAEEERLGDLLERAAIMEFDGGLSRAEADRLSGLADAS